jgi:hypothetical protein
VLPSRQRCRPAMLPGCWAGVQAPPTLRRLVLQLPNTALRPAGCFIHDALLVLLQGLRQQRPSTRWPQIAWLAARLHSPSASRGPAGAGLTGCSRVRWKRSLVEIIKVTTAGCSPRGPSPCRSRHSRCNVSSPLMASTRALRQLARRVQWVPHCIPDSDDLHRCVRAACVGPYSRLKGRATGPVPAPRPQARHCHLPAPRHLVPPCSCILGV